VRKPCSVILEDAETRYKTVLALERLGKLERLFGDDLVAEATYQSALVRLAALSWDESDRPVYRHRRAVIRGYLAELWMDTGRVDVARVTYADSLALLEPLVEEKQNRVKVNGATRFLIRSLPCWGPTRVATRFCMDSYSSRSSLRVGTPHGPVWRDEKCKDRHERTVSATCWIEAPLGRRGRYASGSLANFRSLLSPSTR
jgi:hypothetical protein